jgi:hypothetical protein
MQEDGVSPRVRQVFFWLVLFMAQNMVLRIQAIFIMQALVSNSTNFQQLRRQQQRYNEELADAEAVGLELSLLMLAWEQEILGLQPQGGYGWTGGKPERPWRDPESQHWTAANWYQTMDSMSDSRFKVHFRMMKDTFRSIALKVCPLLDTNWEENPGPNRPIPSAYKLLAVLWRFARGEAFKCLAAVFNLSTAAINQAVSCNQSYH